MERDRRARPGNADPARLARSPASATHAATAAAPAKRPAPGRPRQRRSEAAGAVRPAAARWRACRRRSTSPSTANSVPRPRRRCRRLQARHGLTVDGVVGPATWARARHHDRGHAHPTPRPHGSLRSMAREAGPRAAPVAGEGEGSSVVARVIAAGRRNRDAALRLGRRPRLVPVRRAMTARARSPTRCTAAACSARPRTPPASSPTAKPGRAGTSRSTRTPNTPSWWSTANASTRSPSRKAGRGGRAR